MEQPLERGRPTIAGQQECRVWEAFLEACDVGSLGKSHSKLNFDVVDRLTSWVEKHDDTYLCALRTRSRSFTNKRIGCGCSIAAVLLCLTKITGATQEL